MNKKKTSDFTVSSSKSGYKYDIGNTENLQYNSSHPSEKRYFTVTF